MTITVRTKNSVYTLQEVPDADFLELTSDNPRYAGPLKVRPFFGMTVDQLKTWPVGRNMLLEIVPGQGLRSTLITSWVQEVTHD